MSDWKQWHVPLSRGAMTMRAALDSLKPLAAQAQEVPLIVRLVENPELDFPGIELFHGAVDLHTHDVIHILLGRGLLPKDEAFTIGYTMGSTKQVNAIEQALFGLVSKYFYPKSYRLGDEELDVFRAGVELAHISHCLPLDKLRRDDVLDLTIEQARVRFSIEEDLLRAYYGIEKRRYPRAPESARLLD